MKARWWFATMWLAGCGGVTPAVDGGVLLDAGMTVDAGVDDAGVDDAGVPDAGAPDAGTPDAGAPDAGPRDAGTGPCATDNGGCDALTTCEDQDGGVTCGACPSGYTGSGATGCVNIDECAPDGGASCGLRTCLDTPGSFQCGACLQGYAEDAGTCVDVNECARDAGACNPLTTCTNTVGDYTCSACPGPASTGNGKTGCVHTAPKLRWGTGAPARSLSLCSTVGAGLPANYGDLSIIDAVIESSVASYEVKATGRSGAMPFINVTDIASGMVVTRTTTEFLGRGLVFDIDVMVNTTNLLSTMTGGAVVTLKYCRVGFGQGCVELRDDVQFDSGDSVLTTVCDPPPELSPASDLGEANDDDVTPDFTPTFTVSSTASVVTWLRDGTVMGTSPVVNGVATWTDDGTATAGLHGYSVQHGAGRRPSARRYITLTTAPAPAYP